ncbi:MAG: Nramp family divalent metal transporter, partial [Armatimonadota bacterium]
GSAATALILVLPGDIRIWTTGSILVSTALVLWGRYKTIEQVAVVLAVNLALASLAAAVSVFPKPEELASGVIPHIPPEVDYSDILPWLGFILSGAAGLMWYSYWIKAKGYGAAALGQEPHNRIDLGALGDRDRARLRGWLGQMTLDNSTAVIGTLVVTMAFLILGTELLRPRGLVPEENRVASTLGQLLGGVWGPIGFWFMVLGVFIGFWDTVLSDQDGFGRLFADGTRILLRRFGVEGRWIDERFLKKFFVIALVTVLPIALYLISGEPVGLLKLAGAIEAAHIPIVTGLILYLNSRRLPEGLRPSGPVFAATAVAGLFFAAFAVIYLFRLVSG